MNLQTINSYFETIGKKEDVKLKTFYILDNKKSGRSIVFQKGQKDAIQFMKEKFNTPLKKIIYFLIKINLSQVFLKKAKLDSSVGQLIFLGGQTKIFNFEEKKVFSFLRCSGPEKNFIKNKEEQIEISKKGFAPKILFLDKEIPYSVEELLEECIYVNDKEIFKRLFDYYNTQKIKKISYSSYIEKLERKKSFISLPENLKMKLKEIKEKKKYFYVVNIHGDFGRSQILLKDKNILFIDWLMREGLMLTDLFSFFREDKNPFKNKEFLDILNMFPKEVIDNLEDYLFVSQINSFLLKLISYSAMINCIKFYLKK